VPLSQVAHITSEEGPAEVSRENGRRRVTVAPVTRTARGIRSEVAVGKKEGLSTDSVVTADNIMTVPKWALADRPLGALGPLKRRELDHAIRYALDIRS